MAAGRPRFDTLAVSPIPHTCAFRVTRIAIPAAPPSRRHHCSQISTAVTPLQQRHHGVKPSRPHFTALRFSHLPTSHRPRDPVRQVLLISHCRPGRIWRVSIQTGGSSQAVSRQAVSSKPVSAGAVQRLPAAWDRPPGSIEVGSAIGSAESAPARLASAIRQRPSSSAIAAFCPGGDGIAGNSLLVLCPQRRLCRSGERVPGRWRQNPKPPSAHGCCHSR